MFIGEKYVKFLDELAQRHNNIFSTDVISGVASVTNDEQEMPSQGKKDSNVGKTMHFFVKGPEIIDR